MKRFTWAIAMMSLLLTACTNDDSEATLSISATENIVFAADGTGGVSTITVTTNQKEWDFEMTPEDGAGWLTLTKEGDYLHLTAQPNTQTTPPPTVTITFTAGKAPAKTITVNQDGGIKTVFRVDDLWPNNENPEGIVFYIDPSSSTDGGESGTIGYVMSLKQSPELAWCYQNYEGDYGTNSDVDGRLNWEAVWAFEAANPEYAGVFKVFEWVRDTYGEPWYIPSLQEMRRWLAVYAGLTPEQTEAYMNGRRLSALPREIWVDQTTEHREAYNQRLHDVGGDWLWDPINGSAGPQLWTSTKYDEDKDAVERKPWYVDFLGGWGSASTQSQWDGHLTRAMRRFGSGEPNTETLSVNPTAVTFAPTDTSVEHIEVTKTAASYDATTGSTWVHITKSANSFSVGVSIYTEAEAELANFQDRKAYITVSAGNAPSVTVVVTQTAPEIATPINLEGTWNYSGKKWEQTKTFTDISGTLTSVYNEELDLYIFTGLPDILGVTGLLGTAVDGGVALRITEDNKVEFIVFKPLDIWFDLWGMGFQYFGYYNYATFFLASDNSNLTGVAGLPEDTSIQIGVNSEGSTLTFPVDGTEAGTIYGFGFGYRDIVSLDDHSISPTASPTQPGCIVRDLVLTKVE